MAELQEINRGMKRPASKGKPKELTSPGRRLSCHVVLDAPAVHICVSAMGGKFKPSTARTQISGRKQSRGGGGLAGGSRVPVITTLRTQLPKQAKLRFSFQPHSFFTVCSQGALPQLPFAPV